MNTDEKKTEKKPEADNVNIVIRFKEGVTAEAKAAFAAALIENVEVLAFGSSKGVAQHFYRDPAHVETMRNRLANQRARLVKAGKKGSPCYDKQTGIVTVRVPIIRTASSKKND